MKNATELETKLNEVFVKNAPQLPNDAKKFIVKIAPVASLVIGVMTLLTTWNLWQWARRADRFIDYAHQLCNTYDTPGCGGIASSHFTLWFWFGVIFLFVESVFYIAAFSGLNKHLKQGWNYLYYGALLNVAYAIVSLFTDYDKVGHFLGALVGSAIGFYLLFQMREFYLGKKLPADSAKSSSTHDHQEK
jgi:hypothetical protein